MLLTNIYDNIRLLFRRDKEPYLQFRKILGFYPHDITLYQTALKHKSTNIRGGGHKNNERLEFLGDAVLGCVVADHLYEKYPKRQEGFLTTLRSKLVRRDMLNKLADKIGLDQLVDYNGRKTSAHNSYMDGNAFEALVGAIYLDRGYDHAVYFIRDRVYKNHVDIEAVSKTEENFKSKLIEWCQKHQFDFMFEVVSEVILSDNNTTKFTTRVTIEDQYCGTGEGYSKKESHQDAARHAFAHIKRDKKLYNAILNAHKNKLREEKQGQ